MARQKHSQAAQDVFQAIANGYANGSITDVQETMREEKGYPNVLGDIYGEFRRNTGYSFYGCHRLPDSPLHEFVDRLMILKIIADKYRESI